jgi:hypothetical protein
VAMKAIAALLLLLFCPFAFGQTPTHLRDIHRLFVPDPQWRDMIIGWETVKFDGRKTVQPVGNCQTGFRTFVSKELMVVCDPRQADAELISGASSSESGWAHQTATRTNCNAQAYGNSADATCTTTGGGVNVGTQVVGVASARLVLVSGETVWSSAKDNHANFGQAMALGMAQSGARYVGDATVAADRVIKQFAHDYKASEKSR